VSDPLAQSMVEVLADTSKFATQIVKDVEDATLKAAQAASRVLQTELDLGGGEAINSLSSVLDEGLTAAGSQAGEALGTALGQVITKVGGDSAHALGEVMRLQMIPDAEALGTETAEALGTALDAGAKAAGTKAGKSFADGMDEAAPEVEKFTRDVNGRLRDANGRFVTEGEESGKSWRLGFKSGLGNAGTDEGSEIAAKLGTAFKSAFITLGTGAAAATTALTAFGVKSAGDLQQTQVAFTQLTGSAQNAQKEIASLQQFAAATPFEFKDVSQAATKLLAVGDAAGITQQNLIPVLTTIGNVGSAFGVSGQQINGAIDALSQIAGAGKFDLGNLDQISNNLGGFPARAVLAQQAAQAWGVSTQEALKRISNGALPAQEGIALLLKGMQDYPGVAGGMEKQSETLNGVLSTFADTARNSLSNAFSGAIPQITDALSNLVPVMQSGLDKLGPVISGTLVAILPVVGQFVNAFATVMTPIIPILGEIAPAISSGLGVLAPIFAQLVTAIAPLAGPLSNILVLFIQMTQGILPPLIPVIAALTSAIAKSGLVDAFGALFAAISPLIPVLTGALLGAINALAPVLPPLVSAFAELVASLIPLLPQLVAGAAQFLAVAASLAKMGILDAIVPLIDALATGLTILMPVLKPLLDAFVIWWTYTKLITIATAAMNLVMDANPIVLIGLAVVALIGGLVLLYEKVTVVREVVDAVGRAFKAVGEFIVSIWVAQWHVLMDVVHAVVDFFTKLPGYIGSALSELGSVLSAVWQGVIDGAMAVVHFFEQLPGMILNELIALPGQLLDLLVGGLKLVLQGIGEVLGLIIASFILLVKGIIFAVTELPGMLISLFTEAVVGAYHAIVDAGKAVIEWFGNLLTTIGNELAALPGQLADLFTTALRAVGHALDVGAVAVLHFFETLPGRAVSALSSLGSVIAGVFTSMLSTASGVISKGIDTLVGFFKAVPGKLGDLAKDFVDAGSKLIKNIFDGFAKVPSIGASLAKSVVNGIVDGINWAIDQVNAGLANINVFGVGFGKHTIPDLPEWKAYGGIFDRPTTIGVGEAGREVVVPLTNPTRAMQLAQQSGLTDLLASQGGGRPSQTIYNTTVTSMAQNPEVVAAQVVGRLARKAA